jgi:hypothetical protein
VRNLKARAFALLNKGIDKLQETFPPNRVVLLAATPIGIAAGAANAWVATKFPGLPHFTDGQVTAFAIAGFASVIALAYKFVDGWQKAEAGGTVAGGWLPRSAKRRG